MAEELDTTPIHKLQLMKAIAYLETETVLVADTAAHPSNQVAAEKPAEQPAAAAAAASESDTARVAAENDRMRAELAQRQAANT